MSIKPINDNVLVKSYSFENKTKNGIIVKSNDKGKSRYVKIVAIGDKLVDEGVDLKEGDICVTEKFCGTSLGHDDLVLMNHRFIRCVVEETCK